LLRRHVSLVAAHHVAALVNWSLGSVLVVLPVSLLACRVTSLPVVSFSAQLSVLLLLLLGHGWSTVATLAVLSGPVVSLVLLLVDLLDLVLVVHHSFDVNEFSQVLDFNSKLFNWDSLFVLATFWLLRLRVCPLELLSFFKGKWLDLLLGHLELLGIL